jgi:dTDP-4-amino-4,6-dideoxygalactose transaminase
MRMVANHGQSRLYYFDEIGVNSRLDSIQAAILRCKLPHLDSYNASRRALADAYDAAFASQPALVTPTRAPFTTHVFHQYTLQVVSGSREALKDHLNAAGVPAMIYYPVPLHQQKAYLDPRYKDGDFPVSEKLCATVISLPMQTELDAEQIAHITSSVLSFFK